MKEVSNRDLVLAIELKEENIEKQTLEIIKKYKDINNVYITSFMYNGVRIDIWTHFMRECTINYVH